MLCGARKQVVNTGPADPCLLTPALVSFLGWLTVVWVQCLWWWCLPLLMLSVGGLQSLGVWFYSTNKLCTEAPSGLHGGLSVPSLVLIVWTVRPLSFYALLRRIYPSTRLPDEVSKIRALIILCLHSKMLMALQILPMLPWPGTLGLNGLTSTYLLFLPGSLTTLLYSSGELPGEQCLSVWLQAPPLLCSLVSAFGMLSLPLLDFHFIAILFDSKEMSLPLWSQLLFTRQKWSLPMRHLQFYKIRTISFVVKINLKNNI